MAVGTQPTVPERVERESRVRTFGRPGREESLSAGFVVSPHCNYEAREVARPQFTLLYLLEGRGEYRLRDRSWELGPGSLVLRPPRILHSVYRSRTERWSEFFVSYPGTLYGLLSSAGIVNLDQPVLQPGVTRLTWIRLRSLLNSIPHESGVSTAQLLAESQALLAHLLDMDRQRREGSDEAAVVRRAREVLGQHLEQRLDMPSVAAGLGVGYEAFRKAFCRHQGVPPKEYRIRRKVDAACHLLSVGRASVKQTAGRLGYPDVPSFVKQFRRVMGMPPARYRDLG